MVVNIPEIAKLWWWLYKSETGLVTSLGDEIVNSAGVQQGCPLASLSFDLIIKWMVEKLLHPKLTKKLFFHDDGLLKGSPAALAWAAKLLDDLIPSSGLKMKWLKTECHAPSIAVAIECRKALPKDTKIYSSMNMTFLKSPVGTDDWVEEQLDIKLKELKVQIWKISLMPHLHEAFTLL